MPFPPLQSPSWTANLDDVPNPPGGTLPNGTACVTRMVSITPGYSIDMIPLSWTLLPTDANTNNIGTFPYGAGDGNGMYMSTPLGTFGLPSAGNIGISITGQVVWSLSSNCPPSVFLFLLDSITCSSLPTHLRTCRPGCFPFLQ